MPVPHANSITIVRAATANEESLHSYPPATIVSEPMRGADRLADVALRACSRLLAHIEPPLRDTIGLVIGTAFGCLETDRLFDRSRREADGRYASPAAFSRTLPSTVAAEIALKFSLRGPSLVVSSGATSTSLAILRAMRWMEHFHLTFCIAGGMDWIGPGCVQPESCVASLLLLTREDAPPASGNWYIHRTSSLNDKSDALIDEDLRWLSHWVQTPQTLSLANGLQFTRDPHAPAGDQ